MTHHHHTPPRPDPQLSGPRYVLLWVVTIPQVLLVVARDLVQAWRARGTTARRRWWAGARGVMCK